MVEILIVTLAILQVILSVLIEIILNFFLLLVYWLPGYWVPIEFLHFNKFCLIISGLAAGGISVWLHPEHIISIFWLRTLNLIFTPFLLALLVKWLERKIPWLERIQDEKDQTFWDIYLFALAFAIVRYIFCK